MNILKELCIPSDLSNMNLIQRFVEEVCDEFNINNTYFGNISVVINEAVRNAIIHGNKMKGNVDVYLAFGRKKDAMTFIIKDHGQGFDYKTIVDPTENTTNDAGTGLFLIRLLSDAVNFTEHGSKIEISFFIKSINQSLAKDRVNILSNYHGNKNIKTLNKLK